MPWGMIISPYAACIVDKVARLVWRFSHRWRLTSGFSVHVHMIVANFPEELEHLHAAALRLKIFSAGPVREPRIFIRPQSPQMVRPIRLLLLPM